MRKRSVKFIYFLQTLRFFRKIGQSFLCFSDFPKFTKPAKTFKNTSNFQFFNFLVWTPRPQLNQHSIYIYTFIHFNHQNIPNFFNSMHFFFIKRLGLSWTQVDRLRTSSIEDQSPRSSISKYPHLYLYT